MQLVPSQRFEVREDSLHPHRGRQGQTHGREVLPAQHAAIEPWLETKTATPEKEWRQSHEDRAKLDGLYECILCACCSTSCPSYRCNADRYIGPWIRLQCPRWLIDSRDEATGDRLDNLEGETMDFGGASMVLTGPERAIAGRMNEQFEGSSALFTQMPAASASSWTAAFTAGSSVACCA